ARLRVVGCRGTATDSNPRHRGTRASAPGRTGLRLGTCAVPTLHSATQEVSDDPAHRAIVAVSRRAPRARPPEASGAERPAATDLATRVLLGVCGRGPGRQ